MCFTASNGISLDQLGRCVPYLKACNVFNLVSLLCKVKGYPFSQSNNTPAFKSSSPFFPKRLSSDICHTRLKQFGRRRIAALPMVMPNKFSKSNSNHGSFLPLITLELHAGYCDSHARAGTGQIGQQPRTPWHALSGRSSKHTL